ncbi:MAG: hydantoinase/oxoprolinase family protein [Burkholderiales bacterium]|nr:hydantoinase/oxoprolinase family protein [Burkholderiales bacterium]
MNHAARSDAPSSRWKVGIDIGGTFTDVVAVRPDDGSVRSAKVPTRTDDRVAGLQAALAAIELDWADVADLVHGTTMVTNAIVEGNLAQVALVATEGFADTLAIGRQNRRHLYRLDLPPKIDPLVPAQRRFEVRERLDHDGHVLTPLDASSLDAALEQVTASGAEAVAVSLLHAYADPRHEETVGERLRQRFPFVALSNRINPEAREYERTATTVLSAAVMPLAAGYLDQLERARPPASRLHLFHSAGGMASPEAIREAPLALALSGPAAGVAAAGRTARELRLDNAISFDMGGTTTDVCLILDGEAQISSDRSLAERPLRQPMVAVESIGAGGGSIARFDHGALLVGPESAGATPGPACYGRGGKLPTVTDAGLLLGYMDAQRPIAGGMQLDVAAARAAVEPLARAMNKDVEAAALGILTVVNAAMVQALRRITVERGIDGRRCALLAFGGAGPMHAVEVARAFGIGRVVVPAHSSAFSALGCVSARMSYSQQRTVRMPAGQWDPQRLDAVRAALRERLCAPLVAAGVAAADIEIEEVASVRYRGQSYAIELADPEFTDPAALGAAFYARHERLYGFVTGEPWELVAIRQRACAPESRLPAAAQAHASGAAAPARSVSCVFDASGARPTPRYDRAALAVDQRLAGPCIVEDAWSTVIVPPGATLAADGNGHLHIDAGVAS